MCGFAGIAGGRPRVAELEAMLDTLRHRGPDGTGIDIASDVGLGHARLAIVDPSSAGAQPMVTPDGRYCLAYNGELYNHSEFRPMLEMQGVEFQGHSDTETLLWLLVRCGERILPKLNGIFAFAFLDRATGDLLLARDPVGVKPLYFAQTREGRFLFASEIKALFATRDVEPRLNTAHVAELFLFHFIAGEQTAFANVTELLPGHLLRYRQGRLSHRPYSNLLTAHTDQSAEAHPAALSELVRSGIQRQLMSDVPVGIMSSGGLDSAVVTACAGQTDHALRGFCFRDPESGYDELDAARRSSEPYRVAVSEVRIPENALADLLLKLAWHYDEPIPRPHHLAAYAVAREARSAGFKVLMSGEGGDELFGGYSRYLDLATAMAASGDRTPLVFANNRVAWPRLTRLWPDIPLTIPYRYKCARETEGLDLVNSQLLVDQRTFLQHFLQRSDRMGMAAGVEVRVPLLDLPLVEFTNRVPGCQKVSAGATKRCFREVAREWLPSDVIDRPKQAFELPMASLLCVGPVADMVNDVLLDRPRCGALFEPKAIASLVVDLRRGQTEVWKIVWLLLTTEVWMRTFNVSV
jgi:asparagine synthase (glutamine-hydrolysing)